jgi:hypothetical protein
LLPQGKAAKVGKIVVAGKITGYTKHGINQAISRNGVGVATKAILDAVRNPLKVVEQVDVSIKYIGKEAVVVLNRAGEVVTTFAKKGTGTRMMPGD